MIKLNGHQIKPTLFPDSTSQVWQLSNEVLEGEIANIEWEFSHEAELIHLAQLRYLIDERFAQINLFMPYLPYGRQDKAISNLNTFALKPFADFITSLSFDLVVTLDAHSNKFKTLLGENVNYVNRQPINEIKNVIRNTAPDVIVYPDLGAHNRYQSIIRDIVPPHVRHVFCNKTRNQQTGYIEDITLKGEIDTLYGNLVLMVDDICDGGMTFKLVADELCKYDVKEIHLYTTHGIFSKGLKTLHASGINKVFTRKGEVSELQGNICYRELDNVRI